MDQMMHLRCLFSEGIPSLEASFLTSSTKMRKNCSSKPVKTFKAGSKALEETLKIGAPMRYKTWVNGKSALAE